MRTAPGSCNLVAHLQRPRSSHLLALRLAVAEMLGPLPSLLPARCKLLPAWGSEFGPDLGHAAEPKWQIRVRQFAGLFYCCCCCLPPQRSPYLGKLETLNPEHARRGSLLLL